MIDLREWSDARIERALDNAIEYARCCAENNVQEAPAATRARELLADEQFERALEEHLEGRCIS